MDKSKTRELAEIVGVVATFAAAWVYVTSNLVFAADYYRDNLVIQQSFVEINIDILEDRIERANRTGDVNKAIRLGRRLVLLEQKQVIIVEKQLSK